MASVQEQLRLMGQSLSKAATEGNFRGVATWAARALAVVTPLNKPVEVAGPDLTPLTFEQCKALIDRGRSSDIDEYTQQMFALEAYPELAKPLVGSWPSEATNPEWRRRSLIQFVSSEVGSGPAYGPTPLTNGQVLAAQAWNSVDPGLKLNPVYAVALARAAKVAASGAADSPIPWGPADSEIQVIATGNYGMSVVSWYYGTGAGPVPEPS